MNSGREDTQKLNHPLIVIAVELNGPDTIERSLLIDHKVKIKNLVATSEEDMINGVKKARAVCVGNVPVTKVVIEALSDCWVISRYGAGFDNIDLKAASKKGICVTNTPGANTKEVASHTVALILACARAVVRGDSYVRASGFDYHDMPTLYRFQGSTVGLVGFGCIGREVASLLSSFKLKILAYDPWVSESTIESLGVTKVTFEDLLQGSDYISIHAPLTSETRHLINSKALGLMRKTAYLVNTSRGSLVDEKALIKALEAGRIAGAALDVMDLEPPDQSNPLLRSNKTVLTPHMAALSVESAYNIRACAIENVIAVLNRKWPPNLINVDLLEKEAHSIRFMCR